MIALTLLHSRFEDDGSITTIFLYFSH
jgi:hypothetical protein